MINGEIKNLCRLCASDRLDLIKKSNIRKLASDSFAITDSMYGVTGDLYECQQCGFLQCLGLEDVLSYYEELEDLSYEDTRKARTLQAEKILESIKPYSLPGGRLEDVGAGSGILVEVALAAGFKASGLEPSRWLTDQAIKRELPVTLGLFPRNGSQNLYDIVTMIDVIEHVEDPLKMLQDAYASLKKGGILVVVTPDVKSLVARMLGSRWWHFRVAHIGYFSKKTLRMAFTKAGFSIIKEQRASWYFTLTYLIERVLSYLPAKVRPRAPRFLSKVIIPLNLGDSMFFIGKKL